MNKFSVINDTVLVKKQYSDDKNLVIRINLYDKHSTNKQGFIPWLFDKYEFFNGCRILELGCGNGRQWENRIINLPNGCNLVLSDFSEGMINIVKEKYSMNKNITFKQIDIQNISFENEAFDVIIANHMLYHIKDLNKALYEVSRVLKNGGVFYSATNGNGCIRPFLHNALKRFDPETKAFTQKWSFSLQNGRKLLNSYFSNIKRVDFIDSLSVTETRDLIDWIKSTISTLNFSDENMNRLFDYFEDIRKKEGSIKIPKECGLFISKK